MFSILILIFSLKLINYFNNNNNNNIFKTNNNI